MLSEQRERAIAGAMIYVEKPSDSEVVQAVGHSANEKIEMARDLLSLRSEVARGNADVAQKDQWLRNGVVKIERLEAEVARLREERGQALALAVDLHDLVGSSLPLRGREGYWDGVSYVIRLSKKVDEFDARLTTLTGGTDG